jgi:hypothetical protein
MNAYSIRILQQKYPENLCNGIAKFQAQLSIRKHNFLKINKN